MESVQKGKSIVLNICIIEGLILITLLLKKIYEIFIINSSTSYSSLLTCIVRSLLTIVLFIFIFKGNSLAHRIVTVLMSIAGIITLYQLINIALLYLEYAGSGTGNRLIGNIIFLVLLSIYYTTSALLFLFNKSVKSLRTNTVSDM